MAGPGHGSPMSLASSFIVEGLGISKGSRRRVLLFQDVVFLGLGVCSAPNPPVKHHVSCQSWVARKKHELSYVNMDPDFRHRCMHGIGQIIATHPTLFQ